MKVAKIVFWIAAIWGFLMITPLYFMFDLIGKKDPPAITHPAFFYGFVGVALVWQIAFFVISRDPLRLRPLMIPAMLEKFVYGSTLLVLFMQNRLHAGDLVFGGADQVFGILFVVAF